MIHIKGEFEAVEAKIIKAKDGKAVLCDKNNYSFIDFEGQEVKCEGDDDLSIYLYNKSIDKGGAEGKPIAAKKK